MIFSTQGSFFIIVEDRPRRLAFFKLMINGLRKTFKSHSFPKTFFQGLVRFSSQTLDCPCCNAQALFGLVIFSHHFLTVFWSHSNAMLTSKILPGFITLIYKKNEAQPTLLFKMSTTSRCILQKISKCKNDIVS